MRARRSRRARARRSGRRWARRGTMSSREAPRRSGSSSDTTLLHTPLGSTPVECDVAVLGGGPGGYTAAIRAAQLGAKAVCIEQEPELGGTCLRVGCIPTKAWVQTAHFLHQGNDTFAKLGVKVDGATLDFGAANEW